LSYLANIVNGVADILGYGIMAYNWIILGSVVTSWVNADPYNPIVKLLRNVTEPVFSFIRRRFPFVVTGGLDLSPLVVILALWFASWAIVENLNQLAIDLRR